MGHRVTQRILECSICKRVPLDGEYLWEMPKNEHWCEYCTDNEVEKESKEGEDK